jgi:hypothetical protein
MNNKYIKDRSELEQWREFTESQIVSEYENGIIQIWGRHQNFDIVDRHSLKYLIDEHKLTMLGITSKETRTKLYELMGLTHILVIDCFVTKSGSGLMRETEVFRLVEVNTGKVLQSVRVSSLVPL